MAEPHIVFRNKTADWSIDDDHTNKESSWWIYFPLDIFPPLFEKLLWNKSNNLGYLTAWPIDWWSKFSIYHKWIFFPFKFPFNYGITIIEQSKRFGNKLNAYSDCIICFKTLFFTNNALNIPYAVHMKIVGVILKINAWKIEYRI